MVFGVPTNKLPLKYEKSESIKTKAILVHCICCLACVENIGTKGVQELFFVNKTPLEVANSACQSMVIPVWSVKSDWSLKEVRANCFCASLLRTRITCHVMHRTRALSTKMNNDKADDHCRVALLGCNDLGRSVTPTFLFRNRFYLQLSTQCPKMNKKSMWEVKKISRFLFTEHGILPSCGFKSRETMVAKCEIVLWGTSQLNRLA